LRLCRLDSKVPVLRLCRLDSKVPVLRLCRLDSKVPVLRLCRLDVRRGYASPVKGKNRAGCARRTAFGPNWGEARTEGAALHGY